MARGCALAIERIGVNESTILKEGMLALFIVVSHVTEEIARFYKLLRNETNCAQNRAIFHLRKQWHFAARQLSNRYCLVLCTTFTLHETLPTSLHGTSASTLYEISLHSVTYRAAESQTRCVTCCRFFLKVTRFNCGMNAPQLR